MESTLQAALFNQASSDDLYQSFHLNFEVVIADTPALIEEVLRLRYQVYCVERDFEDPAANPGGLETDAYDIRSVHALVRHRRTARCAGAVRLVLRDSGDPNCPFPIEAHCGGSFYDEATGLIAAADRSRIGEISRFAVSKEFRRRLDEDKFVHGLSPHAEYSDDPGLSPAQRRRHLPHITVGLFAAIVQLSALNDVGYWFAVMEPALLRLLRPFGITFPPIGATVNYHGRRRPTFAPGDEVVSRIREQRPDVWNIITDNGRVLPPRSAWIGADDKTAA